MKKIVNHLQRAEWAESNKVTDRLLLSLYQMYRNFRRSLRNVDDPTVSRLFLRTKNFKRNLSGRNFKFVAIDQATVWTSEWVRTFPEQYDIVVGVPRSGMLIASVIALKLGKGLTTPELLKEGEYWHSKRAGAKMPLDQINKVLLVDDALDKGRAMGKAVDKLLEIGKDFSVTRASLIVREETKHKADLYYKIIEPPRAYEWNLMHRKIASYAGAGVLAVDMDGVLCANPPAGADANEDWYLEWLEKANPYLIPQFEIDVVLTCRLEKYRELTERWLARNNVKYRELVMWDLPDKSHRRDRFAKHKIDHLLQIKPDLYWESNWNQAQRIWEETRIPTLCIDEMTLLG
jgi:adenine/guanine phosphoribosyltransferase-like PRPP-binding protein